MTIREKVRRALRRSAPSPTATSPTPSTSTTASASGSPTDSSKLTSRLANLSLTRRGRSSGSKSKKDAERTGGDAPDPREKPFTETNLRYQEMFGEYTMRFGASRRLSADWEIEGISPMTSRRNSLCGGAQ